MKLLTKIQEFVKRNAYIILHIVVTMALSVILILLLSWLPKLEFPITIALAIAFVYFLYRAVFKNNYADSLLKAGCIIVIFIAANDLYSYDTLSALIPQLLNWNPIILSVIFVAIMIFLFIVIKLAQYMANQEEETQKAGRSSLDDDENKKRNKESFTKNDEGSQNLSGKRSSHTGATNENSDNLDQENAKDEREIYARPSGETFMSRRIRSYAFAFIIVALALLSISLPIYLLYKSHINGIDMEALDFAQTFTFLASYGASGILSLLAFLLAVIVVLYIFRYIIRLLHVLLVEGDWQSGAPNQGKKQEERFFPTYAFSTVVTAVIMFMTVHFTDYKVEDLIETLVSANYLTFPLTVIVIIVSFFVLLQIINSIFVLLGTITPEKIKDYLRKSEEKIGIVSGIMDMLELVIHIIMGSVIAIFGLIDFVPNFFMWMKDFVLGDAPELERKKAREKRKRRWNSEADEQKGGNGDTAADTWDMTAGNNGKPDGQESDNQKGIYIIRVAAFCFAIVSWIATANGLQEYVFTEQSYLQAYMISFGIQSILFVFNLQLPAYFARIGRGIGDRFVRKAFVRAVFAMFYALVLFSSSLFSFVYISRSVYEDTRYNDASVELESMYRTYLSELEQYVDDSTQVALLNISTILSELTGLIPETEEETSIEDLNEALETATLEYNNACVALNTAEERYNGAVATRDESNEVRWRSNEEHELEIQDAEAALSEYESAQLDYNEKESALKKAQDAVDNYEETADMVVNDLLVEFMSASPDEDNIKELMENLNAMVLELAGDGIEENVSESFSNELFAEIVAKNEELSLAVNKYYALLATQSADGEMNDLEDLNNALENGTAIPNIPSSEDDAERNLEIENWKNVWAEYFKTIKELIQNVPEYSENTLNTVKNNYSSIEIESLIAFDKNRYVTEIDDLVRNNLTETNEVEWAWNALNGKYPAMARFSLAFALLLDLSSLLAGLFIYYVSKVNCTGESE